MKAELRNLVWQDRFKTNVLTQAGNSTGANRGNGEGKENLCSLLLKLGAGGVVQLEFDKSKAALTFELMAPLCDCPRLLMGLIGLSADSSSVRLSG